MKDIQPIKRSVYLQPLSREHHDGLLFVWKIRQGLKNNVPSAKLRQYVGWYWANHIRPHFIQEEKMLCPYLGDHPLVQQMKNEHNYIRDLVIAIDREDDRYDFIALANLIEKHIRFEERELFGEIEKLLSEENMKAIYMQLEAKPIVCDEWTEEFWVMNKKAG